MDRLMNGEPASYPNTSEEGGLGVNESRLGKVLCSKIISFCMGGLRGKLGSNQR